MSPEGIIFSFFLKVVWRCKSLLLEMASPDAIARLPASGIKDEAKEIWKIYFSEQKHSSLAAFMSHLLNYDDYHLENKRKEGLLVQVSMMSHHCCFWRSAEHSLLTIVVSMYIQDHTIPKRILLSKLTDNCVSIYRIFLFL